MWLLAITAGLFVFAAWDLGTQNGSVTRPAAATVKQAFRAFGLM